MLTFYTVLITCTCLHTIIIEAITSKAKYVRSVEEEALEVPSFIIILQTLLFGAKYRKVNSHNAIACIHTQLIDINGFSSKCETVFFIRNNGHVPVISNDSVYFSIMLNIVKKLADDVS